MNRRTKSVPRLLLTVSIGVAAAVVTFSGNANANTRAVACPAPVSVAQFEIEVARSKTSCEKALAVSKGAFASFVERPELGDHGVIRGYKCIFGSSVTTDFSTPEGPILFCRSWNRYVVASAEPDDPPTNWSFSSQVLDERTAVSLAAGRVKRDLGRSWRSLRHRAANCSMLIAVRTRRCVLRWSVKGQRYAAVFRVKMIPRRWKDPKFRVSGKTWKA